MALINTKPIEENMLSSMGSFGLLIRDLRRYAEAGFPRLFLAGHLLPIGAGHIGILIDPIIGVLRCLTFFRQAHRADGLIDWVDALVDKYTLAVQ